MAHTLASEAHQRSLKDFLTLYNTITEYCFDKCISNFNERRASGTETQCVDTCTNNYVQYNQRFMFNFVDHQERRKREQEAAAVEAAKQETAALQTMPVAEETNLTQLEQVQKATELLEGLSSSSSSKVDAGLSPISASQLNPVASLSGEVSSNQPQSPVSQYSQSQQSQSL